MNKHGDMRNRCNRELLDALELEERLNGKYRQEITVKSWAESNEDFMNEQHRIFKLVYGRNQKSEKL